MLRKTVFRVSLMTSSIFWSCGPDENFFTACEKDLHWHCTTFSFGRKVLRSLFRTFSSLKTSFASKKLLFCHFGVFWHVFQLCNVLKCFSSLECNSQFDLIQSLLWAHTFGKIGLWCLLSPGGRDFFAKTFITLGIELSTAHHQSIEICMTACP